MKILAIRGKNLASLAGEFEVNFQAEPLASAGLFAITGPTGAGKSTLLDALCLALYERTPRLERAASKNEAIPDVGDNRVTPSDPRTLLRRGASEGFAEADFVGIDGVAYRSRWTVRRAYSKSQGKLQSAELTLTRLTDQQLIGGHTKTETLQQIATSVGLSFDQFTRAVLLAQNDFATFLKASDDDRAELLQTLTGTETFTQISIQAFERMKMEKAELVRLEDQLKGVTPLPPDVRAEREATQEDQNAQVKALEAQKSLTETHLRWYKQRDQLINNEAEARKAHEAAIQAREGAADRYRQLESIDQVQSARPLCADVDRLRAEHEVTSRCAVDARTKCMEADLLATDHQKTVEAAVEVLKRAEASKANLQPQLDRARTIDAKLTVISPQSQAAVSAHDAALRQLEAAQKQEGETEEALSAARKALVSVQSWLEAHAALKPLAANWSVWHVLFTRADGLRSEGVTARTKLSELERQAQVAAKAAETERAQQTTLGGECSAAEKTLTAKIVACQAFDLETLAKKRQQLEGRREQLQSAHQIWNALQVYQASARQLDVKQQDLNVRLEKGELLHVELLARRPVLENAREAAEQAQRIAELAASETAEDLRSHLQRDAPCPVCGALEHPYATDLPQVAAILTARHGNVSEARQSLSELVEKQGANDAELKNCREQLHQAGDELTAVRTSLADEQRNWLARPLQCELAALDEKSHSTWLDRSLVSVKVALTALTQEESDGREALRQRDLAQQAFNSAKSVLEGCEKALAECDTQKKTLAEAQKASAERLVEIEKQLADVLGQLDGAFPDLAWRERWATEPQGFVAECGTLVEDWGHRQGQVTDLTRQIGTLQVTVAGYGEASAKAREQERRLADDRQAQEIKLKEHQDERARLFDGRTVTEVELELTRSLTDASIQLENARQAQQRALNERTRLGEALRNTDLQLGKLDDDLAKSAEALNAWFEVFNENAVGEPLTLEGLRRLLDFDSAWIAAERLALQDLTQAVARTDAVLTTHQNARVQHESGRPTTTTAEALAKSLEELLSVLNSAQERLNGTRLEIAQDDARCKQWQALRIAVDQQSATNRIWSQLGELIGSADGKKFRNFAQQLTLDILLGYANNHLESLARRYRLERIKDTLGLMVVDREMGDEVRSVHSLSGGESFLVSLALAMGLASLSSHRVRVESLFIDEGFGSLDAEALNVAMGALDNLQSLGRKVGVISHVQEMTERIGTQIQVRRIAGGRSALEIA